MEVVREEAGPLEAVVEVAEEVAGKPIHLFSLLIGSSRGYPL